MANILNNFCRLCSTGNDKVYRETDKKTLAFVQQHFLSLSLFEHHPVNICQTCQKYVQSFGKFRTQCVNSEKFFIEALEYSHNGGELSQAYIGLLRVKLSLEEKSQRKVEIFENVDIKLEEDDRDLDDYYVELHSDQQSKNKELQRKQLNFSSHNNLIARRSKGKTSSSVSKCKNCEKVFSSSGLIIHQKHRGCRKVKSEAQTGIDLLENKVYDEESLAVKIPKLSPNESNLPMEPSYNCVEVREEYPYEEWLDVDPVSRNFTINESDVSETTLRTTTEVLNHVYPKVERFELSDNSETVIVFDHTDSSAEKFKNQSKASLDNQTLDIRIEITSEDNHVFQCDDCKESFSNLSSLEKHREVCSHIHRCNDCNKTFTLSANLKNHQRFKICQRFPAGIRCDECDRSFDYPAGLAIHRRSKICLGHKTFNIPANKVPRRPTKASPSKCDNCNQTFTLVGNLLRHKKLKVCTRTKVIRCEECDLTFNHAAGLGKHRISPLCKGYRADFQAKIHCKLCEKTFVDQTKLSRHLSTTHLNIRNYVCEECGAAYTNLTSLQDHKAYRHSDERPLKCKYCPKSFKVFGSHRKHELGHTRKQSCDICSKEVAFGTLRNHMKIHGKKFYKCPHCEKMFHHKASMAGHLLIHLEMKPFNCPYCEMNIRLPKKCVEHIRKHHPDKNYNINRKFPDVVWKMTSDCKLKN